jgi:hypothetical protein
MRYALLVALAVTIGMAPEAFAWGKRGRRGHAACYTTHVSASATSCGCEAAMMMPRQCDGCGGAAAAFSSNTTYPAGTAYTFEQQQRINALQAEQSRQMNNLILEMERQRQAQPVAYPTPGNPTGATQRMPNPDTLPPNK